MIYLSCVCVCVCIQHTFFRTNTVIGSHTWTESSSNTPANSNSWPELHWTTDELYTAVCWAYVYHIHMQWTLSSVYVWRYTCCWLFLSRKKWFSIYKHIENGPVRRYRLFKHFDKIVWLHTMFVETHTIFFRYLKNELLLRTIMQWNEKKKMCMASQTGE